MTVKELSSKEYDPYYGRYIYKSDSDTQLIEGFKTGLQNVISFFETVTPEKLDFKYAHNKWTVKEVLQHLIDTERIFIYRCFRISRNDQIQLAGFDQNIYIEPSQASKKSLDNLLKEFELTRLSSIVFLESLSVEDLKRIGNANGSKMSARAAAFTIIGHDIWHMNVIKEKYLT